jgi:hypothetical protein
VDEHGLWSNDELYIIIIIIIITNIFSYVNEHENTILINFNFYFGTNWISFGNSYNFIYKVELEC